MRKIVITLVCLFPFHLASFSQYNNYSSLKQMKWMSGNWKGMFNGAPFYEAWIYVNDTLMVNLSIEIKNNDTLVKEQGFISSRKGKIIHGGTNATCQLSKLNDTEMIFVNDTLKYANRIIWSHSKDDHWLTEIHNPGGKVINYDLVRVPWLAKAVNKFINRQ